MKRYKVNYKGKEFISKGNTAAEAFEKFANRSVFGERRIIGEYHCTQYDADTYGKRWCEHKCGYGDQEPLLVVTEIVD